MRAPAPQLCLWLIQGRQGSPSCHPLTRLPIPGGAAGEGPQEPRGQAQHFSGHRSRGDWSGPRAEQRGGGRASGPVPPATAPVSGRSVPKEKQESRAQCGGAVQGSWGGLWQDRVQGVRLAATTPQGGVRGQGLGGLSASLRVWVGFQHRWGPGGPEGSLDWGPGGGTRLSRAIAGAGACLQGAPDTEGSPTPTPPGLCLVALQVHRGHLAKSG